MAKKQPKKIESLTHRAADRKNIPTVEYRAVLADDERSPIQVAYERRNRDLDPQLVWRGKDQQDLDDLLVQPPPLYIQDKVHPKVLIDDLVRHSKDSEPPDEVIDLFADFNGLPDDAVKTEFYQHDANWSNRMILGDSLPVMASLADREGLRSKVQCIYFDPPYGIKFNSNFQWSTTSRTVTDGKLDHITREPEQVKAYRDTWRDGLHSYLGYLRDRLTVARELLTDSGSIFVQIGDENVHRVRAVVDEVFGDRHFISQIGIQKTGGFSQSKIGNILDHLLWYAKDADRVKYRPVTNLVPEPPRNDPNYVFIELDDYTYRRMTPKEKQRRVALPKGRIFRYGPTQSDGASKSEQTVHFEGRTFLPSKNGHWKTSVDGMHRLGRAGKLVQVGKTIYHRLYWDSFAARTLDNVWLDTQSGGFNDPKIYVVQTTTKVIQRCILMTTDPGDLVLDPTCGSGTTAYVAEQWARRWITVDTSRVALALARARVMGARYPYYLLADSAEGQLKEAELTGVASSRATVHDDVRLGFVYRRVPHVTLKQIANNTEIDAIWETAQAPLEPLREQLNRLLGKAWEEWEIPREATDEWSDEVKAIHEDWWKAHVARQAEIDASIARNAPFEFLYDKPYADSTRVRVAGPFTVESLSPHRVLAIGAEDEILDRATEVGPEYGERRDFAETILDQLRTAGVQQAHKEDRIEFTSLDGWPGEYICSVGQYMEKNRIRRAGVLIGPEFGTVSRPDLVAAAREAAEAGFDAVIACAFNYDARAADLVNVGRVPILKARMNADLHMSDELKNTGKGNLFVIFGEPDIDIRSVDDGQIEVQIKGVDVFHPGTGEVRSDDTDGIACWFIDTDYNEESFFVRHAYFLGANDPYKALKTTLKAEIDPDAWSTLRSNLSRPFPKPESGRIAVKVINHLGDEVMKVFRV
ncbi:site-specific DNA-methyltransferase [Candidatus Palauibacter sp.]|uniref:site-specific DNA-methyltransferase n=1 Tax=Candidatus Palauibacter sp. TaxID=3101350 RepID=UPI003CC5284B